MSELPLDPAGRPAVVGLGSLANRERSRGPGSGRSGSRRGSQRITGACADGSADGSKSAGPSEVLRRAPQTAKDVQHDDHEYDAGDTAHEKRSLSSPENQVAERRANEHE